MGAKHEQGRHVKTADTIFGIIEALERHDGATATEISEIMDLAPSTAHNHLSTLEEMDYIVKEGNTYKIGLKFLYYGMYAKQNQPLTQVAQPVLSSLAEETKEAAWLVVEEHGMGVYLSNALGENAIQTYGNIGTRTHLHAIAAGKAILAHLPEARVSEIIEDRGLPKLTDLTITDTDALFEELAEIRDAGYALNRGARIRGARAVAAAIVVEGEVYGAIGVSGPEHRMDGKRFTEELPDKVLGAKNIIELELASNS